MTAEHQFLAENIDKILNEISQTSLLGIFEADRKLFDYGCIIQRDFSRPLVSQVLWKNPEGIEKDLRSLIFESNAKLKLYIFKDSLKARAKINEITQSYKSHPEFSKRLRGLRLFPIPHDFDADSEKSRSWVYIHLQSAFIQDLLFQIIFGHFKIQDLKFFINHGGIHGLKYAILHEISLNGLFHMPTFKKRLGYETSGPIKEAILMLKGTGFISSLRGIPCAPTIKGRLFLDLSRKILFEYQNNLMWSSELELIADNLGLLLPGIKSLDLDKKLHLQNNLERLILSAKGCNENFGRDLLGELDAANPLFYQNDYIDQIRKHFFKAQPYSSLDEFVEESSLLYLSDLE